MGQTMSNRTSSHQRFSFRPRRAESFLAVVHGYDVWACAGGVLLTRGTDASTEFVSLARLETMRGCVSWADEILALLWRRPEPKAPIEIELDPHVFIMSVCPAGADPVYGSFGVRGEPIGFTRPTGCRVRLSNGATIDIRRQPGGLHDACLNQRRFELVLREVG